MGLQLEVRERILCPDYYCVVHAALEAVLQKIGITQIEEVEEHVKKLAELITDEGYLDDEYTFTVFRELEVTIYRINYEVDECYPEGCEGSLTVKFEVNGDTGSIKQIVKNLLKEIGADMYVKICE